MDELEQRVLAKIQAHGVNYEDLDPDAFRSFVNGIRNSTNEDRLASGNLQPGQKERLQRLGFWPDGKQRPHDDDPPKDPGNIRGRDLANILLSPLSLVAEGLKPGESMLPSESKGGWSRDEIRQSLSELPGQAAQAGSAVAQTVAAPALGIYGLGKGIANELRDPASVTPRDVLNTSAQGAMGVLGLMGVRQGLRRGAAGTPEAMGRAELKAGTASNRIVPPDEVRARNLARSLRTPAEAATQQVAGPPDPLDVPPGARPQPTAPVPLPLQATLSPDDVDVNAPFEENDVPRAGLVRSTSDQLAEIYGQLGLDEARDVAKGGAPDEGAGFRAVKAANGRKPSISRGNLSRSLNAASRKAGRSGNGKAAGRYRGNEDTGGQPE